MGSRVGLGMAAGLVMLSGWGGLPPAMAASRAIDHVTMTLQGRTVTASAHTASHIRVEFEFLTQSPNGTWQVARPYAVSPHWTIPGAARAVKAQALTLFQARHHLWRAAVASAVIGLSAQAYPALSQTVAHESVTPLKTVQADLAAGNVVALGESRLSAADAQAIETAWGNVGAPAATTQNFAAIFLYAMLAQNAFVFNQPVLSERGAKSQLAWGPTNVSQIDQVTVTSVQPNVGDSGGQEYNYRVTLTDTSGHIEARQVCSVTLNPWANHGTQWTVGVVADMSTP